MKSKAVARTRSLSYVALMLALAGPGVIGCSGASNEDESNSDDALASDSESAAQASSALKGLLATPEQLGWGGEPIATVGEFKIYLQPSKAAADKFGLSANEPVSEFVAMSPAGTVVYMNAATGGVAAATPSGMTLASLGAAAGSATEGPTATANVRLLSGPTNPDDMVAMFKAFMSFVEQHGKQVETVVVGESKALSSARGAASSDERVR